MAVSLSCPSCDYKMKVKDELAGRKIKCPKCSKVIGVPEAEQAIQEVIPARRPAPGQDTEELLRKRPRAAAQVEEEAPPRKKIKKGVLNMDVDELDAAFTRFDVRRFTLAGWLLLAISIVVGMGCLLVVEMNYKAIMGIPRDQRVYTKWFAPAAIAATVGGMGCFFIGWGILYLLGVRVIRPKKGTPGD